MSDDLKPGDRVNVIVYPHDDSPSYQVPGKLLAIRPYKSVDGSEDWADVEHDQYTPTLTVFVPVARLTKIEG